MGFHDGSASKTYTNPAQEEYQAIGIEWLLIAPEGTAFTATASGPGLRVNIQSPPSGFLCLGAVVDDSPEISVDRAKTQLKGGVLSVLQKEWTTDLSGTFKIALRDVRGQKLLYMFGNGQIINVPGTSVTDSCSISSITSRKVITLEDTAIASLVVGNPVVISTAASLTKSYNEGIISAITDDGSYTTVTLVDSLETTPATGEMCAKLYGEHIVAGTTVSKNYVLLGIADTVDGVQIQHFCPKASPAGTWTEGIRRDAPITLPLEFNLLAQVDSQFSDEYVLMRRTVVRSY